MMKNSRSQWLYAVSATQEVDTANIGVCMNNEPQMAEPRTRPAHWHGKSAEGINTAPASTRLSRPGYKAHSSQM